VIELIIDSRPKDLGGFAVRRVLPWATRRMVGPFAFFDHMGPVDFPAGVSRAVDVRPHPHIGLSTASYLFEGEIVHRDSVGSEQAIHPGEFGWMTAGRGVTHSERMERARRQGDRLHGIQAWVALPTSQEEIEPTFSHHQGDALPSFEAGGLRARLIVGEAFGVKAAAPVLSPMFYVHWSLDAGATAGLPAEYSERAAYVVSGEIEADGARLETGQMAVFAAGGTIRIKAVQPSVVMLLGGEPLGERYIEWNFVSSSRERIEQAKADWRAGRLKLPDADDQEFIPLPNDAPPANPG
jgi:redox-sensitive bicupin YhaK (pirin superfamily)